MKAKLGKRILVSAFALGLTLSMLPSTVFAAPVASNDGTSAQAEGDANVEGLNTEKTVTLEKDGTYTINLNAYATGEVKITEEKVPLDIVLVVDQSGSMADPFTTDYQVKYEQFDGSYYQAYSSEVYHVCADGTYKVLNVTRDWDSTGYRYTFSCDEPGCPFGTNSNHCFLFGWTQGPNYSGWLQGGVDWGKQLYKRVTTSTETTRVLALQETLRNFVSKVETDASENNLEHKIAIVGFGSQSGYGNNTEILTVEGDNTDLSNYDSIGVAYNDLIPSDYSSALVDCNAGIVDDAIGALATNGATRTDLGMDMAKKVLATETDSTRKKVVIMFTDGVPTSSNTFDTGVAANAIENAYEMKSNNTDIYTVGIFDDADAATLITNISGNSESANANRFMHATSSNYPDATTWGSYGNPAATNYYMTAENADQLNEVFESIAQSVTGSTSVTLTKDAVMKDILADEFILPSGIADNPSNYVTVQTAYWNGTRFEKPTPVTTGLTVTADETKKTVSVTGFSYKDNYCVEGLKGGQKLIVTIRGIQATDDAVTGTPVYTNAIGSGISEGNVLVPFERPQVTIAKQSYVMDYAKTATINVNGITVSGLDKASDEILNGSTNWTDSVKEKYGVMTKSGSALSYTPSTTQWDGYDSFYAFGKDSSNNNAWTKLSVIPANNVYYEDDFITNESNGTVGIEYTGTWSVDGTSDGNTGEVDGTDEKDNSHGWISSMNDDEKYSDGTAHLLKNGATATFTFTGTGVDIYSRTNTSTGYVVAQLFRYDNEDGTEKEVLTQSYVIDNYAESGDYYQIPTVSFTCPEYGKYKVKLTVASTSDGRSTYYIDGIRVYNPLSESQETDSTVSEAYGDELEATFIEVRDNLLTAAGLETDEDGKVTIPEGATLSGAVFLDRKEETYDVGDYFEYGPKNEVYLANGQAIVISVKPYETVDVGLKAPEGTANAHVTNDTDEGLEATVANTNISSASDLYYSVTANGDGLIMIKNVGDNLLSVTKLKTTSSTGLTSFSLADAIAYANEFDSLPVVEYTAEPSDEGALDTEEPSEPAEEPSDEEGDVVIDNPDETLDQDEQPEQSRPIKTWFENLINGILNMFGRW